MTKQTFYFVPWCCEDGYYGFDTFTTKEAAEAFKEYHIEEGGGVLSFAREGILETELEIVDGKIVWPDADPTDWMPPPPVVVDFEGPLYAVEYIEIDFGMRPEGWSIYVDKDACIERTKAASKRGPYEGGGGYYGPARPLMYYEIPVEGMPEEMLRKLQDYGAAHSDNYWSPKFKGRGHYI